MQLKNGSEKEKSKLSEEEIVTLYERYKDRNCGMPDMKFENLASLARLLEVVAMKHYGMDVANETDLPTETEIGEGLVSWHKALIGYLTFALIREKKKAFTKKPRIAK